MSVLAWCCHNFNFSWPSFLYNVDQGNTCFLSKFKLTWPKSPGWSQVLLHAEAILLCKTKFDGLCVYPLVIEGLASPPLRTSKGHISNAFETIGVVLNPLVSRPCRTPLRAVALHPTSHSASVLNDAGSSEPRCFSSFIPPRHRQHSSNSTPHDTGVHITSFRKIIF